MTEFEKFLDMCEQMINAPVQLSNIEKEAEVEFASAYSQAGTIVDKYVQE